MNYLIKNKKGSKCSTEGNKYEKIIYNIVHNCYNKENNKKFNKQNINELAGSSYNNYIICNWNNCKIPIEIKKSSSPDYGQMCLKYDKNKYIPTRNKISIQYKNIFYDFIKNKELFNNKIPPFIHKNITHEEWIKIKKNTNDFKDMYFDCPNDTIKKIYNSKGCYYIQLSDKGLYHLGTDICKFDVPEFICEQQIRIRIKIHSRERKDGYCQLSVTMSCKPKNIKMLKSSKYSLDSPNKLPINLIYSKL